MMDSRSRWLVFVLIMLTIWLFPVEARADNVGLDLQSILDQAESGQTIVLKAGTYEGPITINKPLTLHVEREGSVKLHNSSSQPAVSISDDQVTISGLHIIEEELKETPTLLVTSDQVVLEGLSIRTGSDGIVVRDANEGTVSNTTIIWAVKGVKRSDKGNGIDLLNAHRWKMTNNTIRGVHDGIYMENSDDVMISDNVIERSRYGIHGMYTKRALIERNVGKHNVTGAMIMASRQASVIGNTFTKQSENVYSQGILLYDTHETIVADNTVDGNRVGFYVEASTKNRLENNRISYNFIGIQLLESSGNTMVGNQFIGNVADSQAHGSENNALSENYWDSFRGLDIDGNGKSDLSYAINPFFQGVAEKRPAFQLFFQSPGMVFLESLYQTERNYWATDTAPLMAPSDSRIQAKHPNDGVITGILGFILLLCTGMIFFTMRRQDT
ncbi:right-handed parallel beta-helix repeat-containing protein [Paenibacillus agilis]|uniref:ABC transporter substrate-binding protein n=1 Tax=Paenibacillus agilis TaxID=3020863 RepID=A0A559IXT1_9BACL|nr:NosD domain-containing protein [Paenibacillus agilis]TVX92445.1 ABC transporter substrate-binding protein [Paenibacillus agilis]